MLDSLRKLQEKLRNLPAPATEQELNDIRLAYLGKKGEITLLSQGMRNLSKEEKPEAGKLLGSAKGLIETLLANSAKELKQQRIKKEIEAEFFDITLPPNQPTLGNRHPISLVMDEIVEIFSGLGFQVEEGPEVESDFHNFESLNFPPEHPARDMQDTFHLEGIERLLRTHTSPVQTRSMKKYAPPLSVIAPGKVYRCDADVTHSPMFHQLEGFTVDKGVTFADLKGTLDLFIHRLYGKNTKTRFRPSYFPFTEPSAEVDVSCVICDGKGCRVCKQTGWLEILGCGMIHPNVLSSAGLDTEQWSGFAFGLGIERVAMLKYGIADIRLFFDNDLRFLRQF